MRVKNKRYKKTKRIIGEMGLKTVIVVKGLECVAEFPTKAKHSIHNRYYNSLGHSSTSVVF